MCKLWNVNKISYSNLKTDILLCNLLSTVPMVFHTLQRSLPAIQQIRIVSHLTELVSLGLNEQILLSEGAL